MKSIAKLYLAYLEMTVISMVLASLVLISVSGFAYGGRGLIPAALAVVMLGVIAYVEIGRHRVLSAHPEFKRKPFGEIRLFLFKLQKRVLKITDTLNLRSRKQVIQQYLSKMAAIIIVALTIWILWSSFSISADIATLKRNQAIVEAGPGVPGTVFNRAVVIEVIQISAENPPKVTAVIKSEGYPEIRIENEGVGFTTTYNGRNRFLIRIIEVNNSSAKFFVERMVE